jgi:hypothetical protein
MTDLTGMSDAYYQPRDGCEHDENELCRYCDPDGYAEYVAEMRYAAYRDGGCDDSR